MGEDWPRARFEARDDQSHTKPLWLHAGTYPPLFTYPSTADAVAVVPLVLAVAMSESRSAVGGGKHRAPRRPWWKQGPSGSMTAWAC